MIVRLDKKKQKLARRQLLNDIVYIISHEALRKTLHDGYTELSPVEIFLAAQQFCTTLLALPDAIEGLDDEIDDLEDETEGKNDAMLILALAVAQMQAMSKRRVDVDFRSINIRIFERLEGHDLLWPLMEEMTNKEDARWLEGKKTDLLNYELQEIKINGGGSEEMMVFMDKYTQATLALTLDEIKSTLIVLSSLNIAYGHAFDEHIALLCDKLGIKPSEIHNHFEKDSGCQVFNGSVSGQFDEK